MPWDDDREYHNSLCESEVYGVACGAVVSKCRCTETEDHFDYEGWTCPACQAFHQTLVEWDLEVHHGQRE